MIATTPSGTRTRADAQAVGADPAVEHLADRVGQRRHLAQAGGHALDLGRGQAQPVDDRGGRAVGLGPGHVGGVGLEQLGGPGDEQVGRGEQGVVRRRRRAASARDAALARRPSSASAAPGSASMVSCTRQPYRLVMGSMENAPTAGRVPPTGR